METGKFHRAFQIMSILPDWEFGMVIFLGGLQLMGK